MDFYSVYYEMVPYPDRPAGGAARPRHPPGRHPEPVRAILWFKSDFFPPQNKSPSLWADFTHANLDWEMKNSCFRDKSIESGRFRRTWSVWNGLTAEGLASPLVRVTRLRQKWSHHPSVWRGRERERNHGR